MHTPYSRPLRLGWVLWLPLGLMALMLLVEPTPLDFALTDLFYQPGAGFSGKHSYVLENLLHDRAKQGVILLGVLALGGWLLSLRHRPWQHLRRPLGYVVLAMTLSTAFVSPLKTLTGVHCPWDLTRYGGSETYTPLLAERAPTLEPGRCWPGGHASSGFSLFALYFVLRDRKPRLARQLLGGALLLGSLLSFGRIMQGAHFLSHNLWTALFDWLICLGYYRWLLYRPQPLLQTSGTESPQGAQA